jgi:hypothetical protein
VIGDDGLVAELAATDVRLAEAVARRVELVLALRRGEGLDAGRGLSDQGLRELQRFVLDLTRREAARAESRRRAGGSGTVLPSGVSPLPSAVRPRGPAGSGRASSA